MMDLSLITDEPLNYCVYAHVNKTNGKMYIGITNNAEHRWARNGEQYRGCIHFYNAIQKYGWDGFDHIVLISNIPLDMAATMEAELIKKYNSIENGYNIKSGGYGGGSLGKYHFKSKPLYQYDLEGNFIKKWECPIDAENYYGVKDLTKASNGTDNRKMAIGFQWSYEYHEKIQPYSHPGNKLYMPIYQYSIDGTFIKKWDCRKDAFEQYGETIKSCAYGNYKTSHGYRWSFEYLEKLDPLPVKQRKKRSTPPHNSIPVIQKTLDGEFIQRFDSAIQAYTNVINSKATSGDGILKACRTHSIYYGYLWEFENQEVK